MSGDKYLHMVFQALEGWGNDQQFRTTDVMTRISAKERRWLSKEDRAGVSRALTRLCDAKVLVRSGAHERKFQFVNGGIPAVANTDSSSSAPKTLLGEEQRDYPVPPTPELRAMMLQVMRAVFSAQRLTVSGAEFFRMLARVAGVPNTFATKPRNDPWQSSIRYRLQEFKRCGYLGSSGSATLRATALFIIEVEKRADDPRPYQQHYAEWARDVERMSRRLCEITGEAPNLEDLNGN